jgi:hypothetical protein
MLFSLHIETAQIAGGRALIAISVMLFIHAFRKDAQKPYTVTSALCILGGLVLLAVGVHLFITSDGSKGPS